MIDGLHWLGGLCSPDAALRGGLLLGLLAAGLAGSVVHCGPMCGVFVLGQVSDRMLRLPPERMCERQRISNGLLVPYHLGRLTTYAGIGALAAGSASVFSGLGWFGGVSSVLFMLAAGLFLLQAAGRVFPTVVRFGRPPRFWGRVIGACVRRIRHGSVFGEYLLGVALGFLPCGLLYAAVAAAAAAGRSAMGAAAMLAFGLGTTPVLMLVGFAGHAAGRRWNQGVTTAAPLLMVLNAILLLALAWQRVT
jgi:sulfite exporter TauE/SafE